MGWQQAVPRESSAIGKAVPSRKAGVADKGVAVLDELLIALVQLRTLSQMAHQ